MQILSMRRRLANPPKGGLDGGPPLGDGSNRFGCRMAVGWLSDGLSAQLDCLYAWVSSRRTAVFQVLADCATFRCKQWRTQANPITAGLVLHQRRSKAPLRKRRFAWPTEDRRRCPQRRSGGGRRSELDSAECRRPPPVPLRPAPCPAPRTGCRSRESGRSCSCAARAARHAAPWPQACLGQSS